jgi:hypothetical protein
MIDAISPSSRRFLRPCVRLLPGLAALLMACDSSPFDASQVPVIRITPVIALPTVTIAWTPAGAQQVRVYKGTVANDQADLVVWSVTGSGPNTLVSPIEYGASNPAGGTVDTPGKPLVLGQAYTVVVGRIDPKKVSKLGITTAAPRYQQSQTFTLADTIAKS